MKKDISELDILCIEKAEVLAKIINDTKSFVNSRLDKSLSNLFSLILFLKTCKGNTFSIEGILNRNIPDALKGSLFKIQIEPCNLVLRLEEYILSKCDEDIQAYYRWALKYEGEDFFSENNLVNIINYENLKLNNPTKNQLYGELASRLLDKLNTHFWNDNKNINLTQKYSLIYRILTAVKAIPFEEGASDNEIQHKIAKYLKAYNTFIEKYRT